VISPSAPTSMGLVHPHSRIDAAMLAIRARLCVRGLFALGINRSIGQSSILMSIFGGTPLLEGPRSMCFAIDISNIEPLALYTRRANKE
jgi:hypothetical protein